MVSSASPRWLTAGLQTESASNPTSDPRLVSAQIMVDVGLRSTSGSPFLARWTVTGSSDDGLSPAVEAFLPVSAGANVSLRPAPAHGSAHSSAPSTSLKTGQPQTYRRLIAFPVRPGRVAVAAGPPPPVRRSLVKSLARHPGRREAGGERTGTPRPRQSPRAVGSAATPEPGDRSEPAGRAATAEAGLARASRARSRTRARKASPHVGRWPPAGTAGRRARPQAAWWRRKQGRRPRARCQPLGQARQATRTVRAARSLGRPRSDLQWRRLAVAAGSGRHQAREPAAS